VPFRLWRYTKVYVERVEVEETEGVLRGREKVAEDCVIGNDEIS